MFARRQSHLDCKCRKLFECDLQGPLGSHFNQILVNYRWDEARFILLRSCSWGCQSDTRCYRPSPFSVVLASFQAWIPLSSDDDGGPSDCRIYLSEGNDKHSRALRFYRGFLLPLLWFKIPRFGLFWCLFGFQIRLKLLQSESLSSPTSCHTIWWIVLPSARSHHSRTAKADNTMPYWATSILKDDPFQGTE